MSAIIYWLVIRGYAIVLRLASLFHPKAKLFFAGRKNLLANTRYALIDERRPRIWMHCASYGEFEQGRPILEMLRKLYPGYALVVTFFSPSGYEAVKNHEGIDYVFYLPLDSAYNAKRFLDIIQPKLCIFVKYDLWYFHLAQIAGRDIPLILIAAVFRKEQPFFKWYGRLHRRMLNCFTEIFVQDDSSKQLLNRIGIEHVTVGGDTRFDRVTDAAMVLSALPIADSFCRNRNILVAGSTWKGDELFLERLMKQLPGNWKLILVPHEVHESHIVSIEAIFEGETIRWSRWNDGNTERVLIVDKIGLLLSLYRYADIAWVGGGFEKDGVHNVLEPAVYGKPVAFGPVFHKFIEARELLAANAAITTDNPDTLAKQIMHWESDKYSYEQICGAAENYVRSKTGATKKVADYIAEKNWLTVL